MPLHRFLLTAAALACAGIVTATVAGGGVAAADPAMPPLPADAFYAPIDIPSSAQPGDILQSRPMPAPFGLLSDVTQIRFVSTDSLGRLIPAIATVLAPPGRHGGPVLIYGQSVNALGLRCAPSQALWSSDPNIAMRESITFNAVLAAGWTMVLPDHLGPRSAYGAAKLGGQIMLDTARAVRRDDELGLGESPLALAGYSGGGMAAAWAAALQPTYAPELSFIGAAVGGVPTNLEAMAEQLGHSRHPAFGLAAAAAFGLEREYGDQLPISEYLNDAGRAYRAQMNDACTNEILTLGAGHNVDDFATSFQLFYSPQTRAILQQNSLVRYAGVPEMPVFEWHSPTDPLIPLDDLAATMDRWRASGDSVTSVAMPAPEHLTAAVMGIPAAIDFLTRQLNATEQAAETPR
ncbi:lipase family protein [Nocardia niigatensis]